MLLSALKHLTSLSDARFSWFGFTDFFFGWRLQNIKPIILHNL